MYPWTRVEMENCTEEEKLSEETQANLCSFWMEGILLVNITIPPHTPIPFSTKLHSQKNQKNILILYKNQYNKMFSSTVVLVENYVSTINSGSFEGFEVPYRLLNPSTQSLPYHSGLSSSFNVKIRHVIILGKTWHFLHTNFLERIYSF